MKEKHFFNPVEINVIYFDGEKDVIATSGAFEPIDWDEDAFNEGAKQWLN